MIKSRKIIILSLLLVLVAIVSAIIIVYAIRQSKQPYYLKSFNNNIALFKGSNLLEVYDDININNLTEYDRYLLRNGIVVKNVELIDEILEDYNS